MYLIFEEFKELTGLDGYTEADFNKYLKKAENVLDNVTNRFYQFNDIKQDKQFRSTPFKLALCAQVIYFSELQAQTFESINKAPQSLTLGRTSISNGSRYNASGANESKSLVCEDVYIYLEGTGLLYRGVN